MDSDRLLRSIESPGPKRPVGAMILAIILLLSGLFVGGDRVFVLLRVFSTADNVVLSPSSYVALLRTAITSITAIVAAIGLLAGSRFGWWWAASHIAWRISTQGILPLLGLLVSQADFTASALTLFSPFLIFGGLLLYLMRRSVKAYYSISMGSVVVIAALLISTLLLAISLDFLQVAVAS